MKFEKNIFIYWIIIMFLVTFTCLLTYLVAQQVIRLGANELPVQFAAETIIKLENGTSDKDAVPNQNIDISKSLDTFVMIFDKDKNLIAASAMMGGAQPVFVKGVLDSVDKRGEYRETWELLSPFYDDAIQDMIDENPYLKNTKLYKTHCLYSRASY